MSCSVSVDVSSPALESLVRCLLGGGGLWCMYVRVDMRVCASIDNISCFIIYVHVLLCDIINNDRYVPDLQ